MFYGARAVLAALFLRDASNIFTISGSAGDRYDGPADRKSWRALLTFLGETID